MVDYQVVLMDFPFKESVTRNEDDFYKENADKIEFDTHISDLSFN